MTMKNFSRRDFIKTGSLGSLGLIYGNRLVANDMMGSDLKIKILNPRNMNPVSLIIDDSTSLVNLAHFGIPQFREIFPAEYPQDWRKLPREIPDDFIREFGDWCGENGVKGKFSMVPYPACTGWLHRFIPGWSNSRLKESVKLVRDFMMPHWDIHPEMISHTRVIDLKTGIPYAEASPSYMENWEWSQDKSADELGSYIAYALNVLKEAGFYCEGMTTPGGFGSRNTENLALGTRQAVKDVFGVNLSHFFRDVITEPGKSVEPQIYAIDQSSPYHTECAVHIIGCTDDWFGGWDGLTPGNADKMITGDLSSGRIVEVIEKNEPAIMVCHWPGIYFNGDKYGFHILKEVVQRLNRKYQHLFWMKQSEIARYWAAKKLTTFSTSGKNIVINAPFETSWFTLAIPGKHRSFRLMHEGKPQEFTKVLQPLTLDENSFYNGKNESIICFHLPAGDSLIETL